MKDISAAFGRAGIGITAHARFLQRDRGANRGRSGTGKTSLLRLLNDQLHPGLFKDFHLCHLCVWVLEFYPHLYTHLCDAFGLESKGGNRISTTFWRPPSTQGSLKAAVFVWCCIRMCMPAEFWQIQKNFRFKEPISKCFVFLKIGF
jgi:hypothetical protein